jgi:hypothetical protein
LGVIEMASSNYVAPVEVTAGHGGGYAMDARSTARSAKMLRGGSRGMASA